MRPRHLSPYSRFRTLIEHHQWLRGLGELALANDPVLAAVRSFTTDASDLVEERARYLQRPVKIPVYSAETVAIVERLAGGEQVFGLFAFKEKRHRSAIEAIQIMGRTPADTTDWTHVRAHLHWRDRLFAISQQWETIAAEIGAPPLNLTEIGASHVDVKSTITLSELIGFLRDVVLGIPAEIRLLEETLPYIAHGIDQPASLWSTRQRLASAHNLVRTAIAAARLSAAKTEIKLIANRFGDTGGKVGALARKILIDSVGRRGIDATKLERAWDMVRATIDELGQLRPEFETVRRLGKRIEASGAPQWAKRVLHEPVTEDEDPLTPRDWDGAWDWAAGESYLQRIDKRDHLHRLSEERVQLEQSSAKTFARLVRERTFYALGRSMTGQVRSALMMFTTAVRRIGKGTGKGAVRHRRDARSAMSQCYDAIPCWIMPCWRVAEQLPGTLGSFDLVIMDEASQSDIKEVTTLLRGRKVLVVGDDKQVSPTAAFIEDARIERLARGFLENQPFKTLLLPGASLYDLAKVMFPDKFVMLREHFRCVEPIIRFSMQFYPEPLVPLRVPTAQERIDPPLVDIYLGRRTGDKTNHREAQVIVEEVQRLVENPHLARVDSFDRWRTIGVVSLIGAKQSALINRMLLDELGEEIMLRHRIACGDSATFQGNERDVVFLSMVADPDSKQSQTAAHFEQRFNVALSRARDQVVLVRSVREEELNPNDLKAKVIRTYLKIAAGGASPINEG